MTLDEEIKRVKGAMERSKSDKLKRDYQKYLVRLTRMKKSGIKEI